MHRPRLSLRFKLWAPVLCTLTSTTRDSALVLSLPFFTIKTNYWAWIYSPSDVNSQFSASIPVKDLTPSLPGC